MDYKELRRRDMEKDTLLESEKWAKIDGYKYDYEVSSLGRFRIVDAFHYSHRAIKAGFPDTRGYLRVSLTTKEGKLTHKKVHRLVAEYFLQGYANELTVNHKDFDKTNNTVENLELLSASDNVLHYQENKVQPTSSSKVKGVGYHAGINQWTCRVTVKGKRYSIGTFKSEEEAIHARNKFLEIQDESSIKTGKGKYKRNKLKP